MKDEIAELKLQTSSTKEIDHGILIENLYKQIGHLEKVNSSLRTQISQLKEQLTVDLHTDAAFEAVSKRLYQAETILLKQKSFNSSTTANTGGSLGASANSLSGPRPEKMIRFSDTSNTNVIKPVWS